MQPLRGFSLIEMLVVLAIIGVLAMIAVPSYHIYLRRAHYAEIVQAVNPYKLGVEECYQVTGALTDCATSENGVPPAINIGEGAGMIGSIHVSANGVITITPQTKYGIETTDTYVLTPKESRGKLTWHSSGGGPAAGYVN